jgi:hypothetical protein
MTSIKIVYADSIKRGDIFVRGNNDEDLTFKIHSIDKTSIKDYVYITDRKGNTMRLSRLCLWKVKS